MNNSTQITQVNIYKSGASWFGARWAGAEFDGCDPIEADDEAEAMAQACLEFPGANITRVDDESAVSTGFLLGETDDPEEETYWGGTDEPEDATL